MAQLEKDALHEEPEVSPRRSNWEDRSNGEELLDAICAFISTAFHPRLLTRRILLHRSITTDEIPPEFRSCQLFRHTGLAKRSLTLRFISLSEIHETRTSCFMNFLAPRSSIRGSVRAG
jgi:hypothetical protein